MRYICFNLCADFYSNFAYVIDIGSNFWVVLDICLNFYVLKIYLSLLKVMNFYSRIPNTWNICWNLAIIIDLPLCYTISLVFLYLFSLKNSGWFLTKTLVVMGWLPELPKFHTIFTTNYHVDFDFFWGNKIIISKWCSFDNLLFQSGVSIISKWGRVV